MKINITCSMYIYLIYAQALIAQFGTDSDKCIPKVIETLTKDLHYQAAEVEEVKYDKEPRLELRPNQPPSFPSGFKDNVAEFVKKPAMPN